MIDARKFFDIITPNLTNDDINYICCTLNEAPNAQTKWPPTTLSRAMQLVPDAKNRAFYISTMTAKRDEAGRFRNKQASFHALNMVVLDDIGTKVDPNNLMPTYVIESSSGNYQWGYVLTHPITDHELASKLVSAIYETDLSDGGGKMVNKFVRLPFGINGKQNGDNKRNDFSVSLIEFNAKNTYTVDELLEGFNIELNPTIATVTAPASTHKDPVYSWLSDNKLIRSEDSEWSQIRCPWADTHSPGTGDEAAYSAIGRGNTPTARAFHCFHGHCEDKRNDQFLDWVASQGGPNTRPLGPIQALVERYVLLEFSNEVADTQVDARAIYPIVSLTSFRNANRQFEKSGERGGKQYYGEMWLEHPQTVRCKGRTYDPKHSPVKLIDNVPYFNTYRAPSHVPATGDPAIYLEHIDWLIPNEYERELFHNWIAQKLQKPHTRSYAVILVASLKEGEDGFKYGTGRSTVGDILGKVFQSGVAKIDLKDLVGNGDSQSAYNDWADGTQLCVIEETKEEIGSWRADHASYEALKKTIDTRPIPGVRVKPKYGKIYITTLYANFLFFSNHDNALMLPVDDRRICAVTNAKGRRTIEEYAQLQEFLASEENIAQLYHWYMARDISKYDHIYPPMTPAKQAMITSGVTTLDEIWNTALENLKGDLVTRAQLLNACERHCSDVDMQATIPAMVRAKWKHLAEPCVGWYLTIKVEGKNRAIATRILRNHEYIKELQRGKQLSKLRSILNENKDYGI